MAINLSKAISTRLKTETVCDTVRRYIAVLQTKLAEGWLMKMLVVSIPSLA